MTSNNLDAARRTMSKLLGGLARACEICGGALQVRVIRERMGGSAGQSYFGPELVCECCCRERGRKYSCEEPTLRERDSYGPHLPGVRAMRKKYQ